MWAVMKKSEIDDDDIRTYDFFLHYLIVKNIT